PDHGAATACGGDGPLGHGLRAGRREHIPLHDIGGRDVMPLQGQTLVTGFSRPGWLFAALGADGRVLAGGATPIAEVQDAPNPFLFQTAAAVSANGATWAATFPGGRPAARVRSPRAAVRRGGWSRPSRSRSAI